MRQITKDIEITFDGSRTGFRLSKLDAFSGVMLLRLLMRLENTIGGLEIGQGIMNAVAGCFISFDKLDFIAPQQRSVEEDRVVRVKDSP